MWLTACFSRVSSLGRPLQSIDPSSERKFGVVLVCYRKWPSTRKDGFLRWCLTLSQALILLTRKSEPRRGSTLRVLWYRVIGYGVVLFSDILSLQRLTGLPRSKIVENLAVVNYDTNNLYLAPYDWRLSYYNLEERDGYFSRLKSTIEGLRFIPGCTPWRDADLT